MKKEKKPEQNKRASKKLSSRHESDNAGDHKGAHHRGDDEQNKDLRDSSSRATNESNRYRSGSKKNL